MKTIRITTFAILTLISSMHVAAQNDIMYVKLANGTIINCPVSEIDEISFGDVILNIVNGHEYTDLGLPSGVKWATCNIGATTPSEFGDYFAWGETEPKSNYIWDNSTWYHVPYVSMQSEGVIDANGNLTSLYDTGTVNWGADWRMPTLSEVQELLDHCVWEWDTQDGINGYTVTGPNGDSIFLPNAGYYYGSDLYGTDTHGCFWCATVYEDENNAYSLYFHSESIEIVTYYRSLGFPVRPVTK